ncbi:MAG TPA: Hpt domain-containing protein, partial [Methylomirabilota bacterium]|nr:Hpt domain-containing protein [Methylomirabilota bacterium]
MPDSKQQEPLLATLAQLTEKIAMELVFAEPGKDIGLLPANALLTEMEETAGRGSFPEPLGAALRHARAAVDAALDKAGFTPDTLQQLHDWAKWMQTALPALQLGKPLPPLSGPVTAPTAAGAAPAPAGPLPPEEELNINAETDADLLREFINESQEHLQNIELGVLSLEENPRNADTLNSIFRAFHTFKGGSGFLNLTPIKNLAHELESLLDLARNQRLEMTSPVINLILEGGDTLKKFIAEIDARISGRTPPGPIVVPTQALLARVRVFLQEPGAAAAAAHTPAPSAAPNPDAAPASTPPPPQPAA